MSALACMFCTVLSLRYSVSLCRVPWWRGCTDLVAGKERCLYCPFGLFILYITVHYLQYCVSVCFVPGWRGCTTWLPARSGASWQGTATG